MNKIFIYWILFLLLVSPVVAIFYEGHSSLNITGWRETHFLRTNNHADIKIGINFIPTEEVKRDLSIGFTPNVDFNNIDNIKAFFCRGDIVRGNTVDSLSFIGPDCTITELPIKTYDNSLDIQFEKGMLKKDHEYALKITYTRKNAIKHKENYYLYLFKTRYNINFGEITISRWILLPKDTSIILSYPEGATIEDPSRILVKIEGTGSKLISYVDSKELYASKWFFVFIGAVIGALLGVLLTKRKIKGR